MHFLCRPSRGGLFVPVPRHSALRACHAARPPRRTTAQHFAKNAAGPRRGSAQPVFPSACFAVVLLPGTPRFGPVTLRLARGRVDKPGLRRKCRSGHKALRLVLTSSVLLRPPFGGHPLRFAARPPRIETDVSIRKGRTGPQMRQFSASRETERRGPVLTPSAPRLISPARGLRASGCHAAAAARRAASLRLGLVFGPPCGPPLALAPVHPRCSARLRASYSSIRP